MKSKTTFIALTLAAFVLIPGILCAQPQNTSGSIPFAIVTTTQKRNPEARQGVAEAIPAPLLRGERLLEAAGLVHISDLPKPEEVTKLMERGKDLYFEGKHEKATEVFSKLLALVREHQGILSAAPDLRPVVFKTLLYRQMSRDQTGSLEGDADLQQAARNFPDQSPSPKEFPPILRRRLSSAKASSLSVSEIRLDAPAGCALFLEGRPLKGGPVFKVNLGGEATALARCHGKDSMISKVSLGKEPARFEPVFIPSPLEFDSTDLVISAKEGDVDDALEGLGAIARAAGKSRVACLVEGESPRVVLLDTGIGTPVRSVILDPSSNADHAARLVALHEMQSNTLPGENTTEPYASWYENALAWTSLGAGLAAVATGLVLTKTSNPHSSIEPVRVGLIAGGATISATGIVLFFVPAGAGDTKPSVETAHSPGPSVF